MVVGIDGFTEFRRSLDDNLEVTAEDGEVIDLIGTVESLERRIEIAQGDAFTGDFVAVDFQLIARGVSGKSRVNRTDFRTLAGSGDDFLCRFRQFSRRMAAAVFKLHGEARRRTHTVNWRRVEGDDRSLRNLSTAGYDLADQGVDRQILGRTLIPVGQTDEGSGGIRFLAVGQDAVTDDVHGLFNTGLFFQPIAHFFTDFLRFRLRNAFRQGDIHHDEGTVFGRYEACRHDFENTEGGRTDDDQEDDAPAQVEL